MNRYRRELTWFLVRVIVATLVFVASFYTWGCIDNRTQPQTRTYIGTYHCLNCGAEMVLYTNVED